ncbi:MAG TPA: hypothetical protein VMV92_02470 [Streptosporangiaceae bacterium]|nr:hypothetical protein [Streptosporangiaceae bacterium]
MTTPVELPALDGRDPLGFLAALGLLRVITAACGPEVRLAFAADTGRALLLSPLPDISAIAAELTQVVSGIGDDCVLGDTGPGFPLRKGSRKTLRSAPTGGESDPMRVSRENFRGQLHAGVAELRSPAAADWLTVLVTDLATDRQGRAALTPYHAPAGQQSLWTFFEKPLAAVRAEPARLTEALTGWRRTDRVSGEYFDHRVLRSAADHPAGHSTEAGVPGATWLATQALPLLRLTGDGRNPAAALWHRLGRRMIMIWPLWNHPLGEHAIRVLLEHPLLRPRPATDDPQPPPRAPRSALAPLGVFDVCGAERQPIEGRKSAGVLAPIPVMDT